MRLKSAAIDSSNLGSGEEGQISVSKRTITSVATRIPSNVYVDPQPMRPGSKMPR